MKKGFDPRMMYANYYLVPPASGDLTGVTSSELGGHFVATADIYDDIPKAMEQLPYVRTQKEVEDDDGYYCVGFQRMDRDLRAQWYYTDKDGYDLLYDGEIDILEAKARPQYQEHIAYLNKVHSHDVMDKPEIRPTCGNKFDFFRQRADEMYEHNEEVYEKYFEAKEVVVAGRVNKSKHTIPPDFNGKKKELQMFLRDLDLYHGGIDGIFGKKSNEAYQEALDEFQFTKDDMLSYVDGYIVEDDFNDDSSSGGKRIALVVGHRSGAKGATNTRGASEYDFWDEYLNESIDRFRDGSGNEFRIFHRRDNDGRGYTARITALTNRVNDYNPDLTVSFHFNSAGSRAEGFEILATDSTKGYAKDLLDEFDSALKGDNRGVKVIGRTDRGGGFLYRADNAILVEPFFGSSKIDTENFYETQNEFTEGLIHFFKTI